MTLPAKPSLSVAFNLPPEAAVEYFNSRGMRVASDWKQVAAAVKSGGFSVAAVTRADVLADIHGSLRKAALEGGQTYEAWLKTVRPMLAQKGWLGRYPHDPETGEIVRGKGLTPWRLETVFRTNLQTAYMSGRYKSQLENADRRGNWQYVSILDNRTRPAHRALNNRVFRYDDPVWEAFYPPLGYNCRCRVRALSDDELETGNLDLSQGEGQMETVTRDLGPRGGKVDVIGYRDPATKELFTVDPGFDFSPASQAWGRDIALARNTQAIASREIRTQVWQALNNSPARLTAFYDWANKTLDIARPGNTAQVIGFVDEGVTDFMALQTPDAPPTRIVAINEKRLVHAESARHETEGIALTRDQVMVLPGLIAKPDAVYFDTLHGNYAYVRQLANGGVIFAALDTAVNVKKAGQLDALVNAFRLKPGANGAGRLNTPRFVKMKGG